MRRPTFRFLVMRVRLLTQVQPQPYGGLPGTTMALRSTKHRTSKGSEQIHRPAQSWSDLSPTGKELATDLQSFMISLSTCACLHSTKTFSVDSTLHLPPVAVFMAHFLPQVGNLRAGDSRNVWHKIQDPLHAASCPHPSVSYLPNMLLITSA